MLSRHDVGKASNLIGFCPLTLFLVTCCIPVYYCFAPVLVLDFGLEIGGEIRFWIYPLRASGRSLRAGGGNKYACSAQRNHGLNAHLD
jgi:hypothetical protein